MEDVLENEEVRLRGTEVPLAVSDCDEVLDFDALFRTILSPSGQNVRRKSEADENGCQ